MVDIESQSAGDPARRQSTDIARSGSGSGVDNNEVESSAPNSSTESIDQHSSCRDKRSEAVGFLDASALVIAPRPASEAAVSTGENEDFSDQQKEALVAAMKEDADYIRKEMGAAMPVEEPPSPPPPPNDNPNLVAWSGPDDPENPKNWPYSRRWAVVFVVSTFTLMSPMSSSMIAPSLTAIGEDLDIPDGFGRVLALSIFVLAYAIGPLLWGPLSELYGRVIVLQLTNLIYMVFNLGCGLAQTQEQLVAFRFLAGLGGSAPLAIGGGVLTDHEYLVFTPEERGKALSVYALMPLLGPAIGPIAGGFITEGASWRWVFYATTIADAIVQGAGLFFLRETYAPVLLARRRDALIKETGNTTLRTPYDDETDDDDDNGHSGLSGNKREDCSHSSRSSNMRVLLKTLRIAFVRPFRLLATQPIIQFLALYMMYLYGLMYIVLSTFPTLWSAPRPAGYGMGVGVGGLNYLSLGLGCFLGAQTAARAQDRIYAALKRRNGNAAAGRPEYRVPLMVPAALLVPAGLLIYGWTAQQKTHWVGPDAGVVLFSAGVIVGNGCVQGYVVDAYPRYAASGMAAVTVLRSLAGFGFPLFAPAMYDRLGMGWSNTILALVGVVIGWPGPPLLWRFGEALRRRSPYAAN
ncbi:hypothetical protein SLS62_004831 [Diatrype stigma]|uniref:Major facilitator superfamily (MFS) profile domain-containing protein n=1 Tax=Diatrype stigma TaxID=117547 RepID=A0AAN9UU63_9PEZI